MLDLKYIDDVGIAYYPIGRFIKSKKFSLTFSSHTLESRMSIKEDGSIKAQSRLPKNLNISTVNEILQPHIAKMFGHTKDRSRWRVIVDTENGSRLYMIFDLKLTLKTYRVVLVSSFITDCEQKFEKLKQLDNTIISNYVVDCVPIERDPTKAELNTLKKETKKKRKKYGQLKKKQERKKNRVICGKYGDVPSNNKSSKSVNTFAKSSPQVKKVVSIINSISSAV